MESQESYAGNPELTVIVAVYNSAPYLKETLASLFSQRVRCMELILIDDCSTDGSRGVISDFLAHNPVRDGMVVRSIRHDNNLGLARTRAEGVSLARGEWIIFCDSDDVVEYDAYPRMLETAYVNDVDIVVCGFKVFGERVLPGISPQGDGVIFWKDLFLSVAQARFPVMHGSVCNKLMRRRLWKDVVFPDGLFFWEDIVALFQILMKKPSVYAISEGLYHYRIRSGSLVATQSSFLGNQCGILIPFFENLALGMTDDIIIGIRSKIIELLYRLLKSGSVSAKDFQHNYGAYLGSVDLNIKHNFLERMHLRLALSGNASAAFVLGFLNDLGYSLIKTIRYVVWRMTDLVRHNKS